MSQPPDYDPFIYVEGLRSTTDFTVAVDYAAKILKDFSSKSFWTVSMAFNAAMDNCKLPLSERKVYALEWATVAEIKSEVIVMKLMADACNFPFSEYPFPPHLNNDAVALYNEYHGGESTMIGNLS